MISSPKTLISLASITAIVGFSSLITLDSAHAYSVNFNNGDFENSVDFQDTNFTDGWEGAGDSFRQGAYSSVAPFDSNQGIITTSCPGTAQTGECLNNRNDDDLTANNPSEFNKSGNDQISASVETTNNLQSILGLSNNAFSIPREIGGVVYNGANGNPLITRTPKEGSAIYQDITIINDASSINNFTLNFNWNFLTNDGATELGDQDFAFVSITGDSLEKIYILEDSTGTIPTVAANADNFGTPTAPYAAYVSEELALTPGTYRVGLGVVDVDGIDRSSALLIDNFQVQEVPFEFSPTFGLLFMGGFFGLNYFRRSRDNKTCSKH